MIEHFFDVQKPESKKLFADFKIARHKEFCEKHQNKYPVINISLKDIKETNWEECLDKFKAIISNLYKNYKFLLKSERLDKDEIDFCQNIISRKADKIDYKASLVNLSKYLQQHFEKEVIILVDEYDTPIISA
ncbi:MAG: 9-O-acetyl-N-acetylneuraminate esterase, partial [Bacteroidia bacterium]